MMQMGSEYSCNKHSLMNTMNRFIAAANNMDETIMVPSLLRDVPLDEQEDQASCDVQTSLPSRQRDMYEHYLLLKSIRNDMEWGLLRQELCGSYAEQALKQEVQEEDLDLQGLFHYHLQGLFGVLSKLTVQANRLTNRYKREIGGGSLERWECSSG